MTEGEARKIVRETLERHKDSPEDVVWVEDLLFETDDAFVLCAGSGPEVFPPGEDKGYYSLEYAVNKKTGKCGLILLETGTPICKETFGWESVTFFPG